MNTTFVQDMDNRHYYTLHLYMYYKTIQMFFEISYRGRLPFRGETIQLSTGGQFYCLMPDRKLRWNRSGYYKPEANLSPAGYSDKKLNTNPLQNITPYITNSVVNFTIDM
jgi:hypothetical protein